MDHIWVLCIASVVGLLSIALGVFVGWLTWRPAQPDDSGKTYLHISAGTIFRADGGQIVMLVENERIHVEEA